MEKTVHFASEMIEKKLREFANIEWTTRHCDLTQVTGDPGNTCLGLTFVEPMVYDLEKLEELLISEEGQGSPIESGDVTFIQQNTETLILISSIQ